MNNPSQIRELGALVIALNGLARTPQLQHTAMRYDFHRLFVVLEDDNGETVARTVSDFSSYRAGHEVDLEERALACEDGLVLHQGVKVSPEKYLRMWELAAAKPIMLTAAIYAHGLRPRLHISCDASDFENIEAEDQALAMAALGSAYLVREGGKLLWSIPVTESSTFSHALEILSMSGVGFTQRWTVSLVAPLREMLGGHEPASDLFTEVQR